MLRTGRQGRYVGTWGQQPNVLAPPSCDHMPATPSQPGHPSRPHYPVISKQPPSHQLQLTRCHHEPLLPHVHQRGPGGGNQRP